MGHVGCFGGKSISPTRKPGVKMNSGELFWIGVGAVLSIAILSYLIGDNFLFRIASHIFVGLTAGYLVVLLIYEIIWPLLIQPILIGNGYGRLWMGIPFMLIVLLILSQFPRFKGFSSYPLAFITGVGAAVVIGGALLGTLLPQSFAVVDIFDPSGWDSGSNMLWLTIAEAVIMLLGVIGTLSYFHFGRKRNLLNERSLSERPLVFEAWGKVGQVFIGIALGSVFVGVFSTTLTALIDRILAITEFIETLLAGGL
jgi:hypothetical protein